MNTTAVFPSMETLVKPFRFPASPYEYKVTTLRECPTPDAMQHCETPDKAADYWRLHIASPVSYTHLDVYKRQQQPMGNSIQYAKENNH